MTSMTNLASTLDEVRRRIRRAGQKPINEQNTKATLIEPLLRVLGWDVEDIEEVQREFKLKQRDKPVDYGLLVLRTPRLFLEAKALGENLDDRRWASQIMGYAAVAGVEWVVLTDGNEYRIYNSHAPVAVEEKLFRTVKLLDDDPTVIQTLELLAKNRLEENRIEVIWRAIFVDRQVQAAIEELFSRENDMLLVNHVASRVKNLTTQEIRASLVRCNLHLDFPVDVDAITGVASKLPTAKRRGARGNGPGRSARMEGTTLQDLIAKGILQPPVDLVHRYKGQDLRATILKDGRVRVGAEDYSSPSLAAGAARATLIGKRADGTFHPTNGWDFWRVDGSDGKRVPLDHFRRKAQSGGRSAG